MATLLAPSPPSGFGYVSFSVEVFPEPLIETSNRWLLSKGFNEEPVACTVAHPLAGLCFLHYETVETPFCLSEGFALTCCFLPYEGLGFTKCLEEKTRSMWSPSKSLILSLQPHPVTKSPTIFSLPKQWPSALAKPGFSAVSPCPVSSNASWGKCKVLVQRIN